MKKWRSGYVLIDPEIVVRLLIAVAIILVWYLFFR